jgi:DNA-binding transcriptional regulator YiaG
VAPDLGVTACCLRNWEVNRTQPAVEFMPAIIRFLDYNPLPSGNSWAERLLECRTALGLSQKLAAKRIGVDQSTLARWERGDREPTGQFTVRVTRFLDDSKTTLCPVSARAS